MEVQFLSCVSLALFFSLVYADNDGGSGGGSGSDSSGGGDKGGQNIVYIHGIIMGIAFAVLFPLGAIILRLFTFRGIAWVHGIWQSLTYLISVAGLGLGIYLTCTMGDDMWTADGHAIIGIIVIAALTIQPIGGIIHHLKVRGDSRRSQTLFGISHRWIGRIFLILGAINGGLGLNLANEDSAPIIAYSVLAAVFFTLWALVDVWSRRNDGKDGKTRKVSGFSSPSERDIYALEGNR